MTAKYHPKRSEGSSLCRKNIISYTIKKRGARDTYCYGVYHSTNRVDSVLLEEIAPKYPIAKENLEMSSNYFKAEADIRDQCTKRNKQFYYYFNVWR
jgi:hypothetical protein